MIECADALCTAVCCGMQINLPALDFTVYYENAAIVDLHIGGGGGGARGQRIAQNVSSAAAPTTASGLPLTPCHHCAQFRSRFTVSNDTNHSLPTVLSVLALAYRRDLSLAPFSLRTSPDVPASRTCVMNRIVADVQWGLISSNSSRGFVRLSTNQLFDGISFVVRDVSWLSSSYRGFTTQFGAEIGPRVFFVSAEIPTASVIARLLPPSNVSSAAPIVLGSITAQAFSLQRLMNRYRFSLALDSEVPSDLADCFLAPLFTGRTDGVPTEYFASSGDLLYRTCLLRRQRYRSLRARVIH